MRSLVRIVYGCIDVALALPVVALALASRAARRPFDVGLGPRPLLNNVHHKRALERAGYRAETFANEFYYISRDFDRSFALPRALRYASLYAMYASCLFRYRCLYVYFDGGPLGDTALWWRFEPWLYRLAGVRTVILPYGGDVYDLTRSRNLRFKHALATDYPEHHRKRRRVAAAIDAWTRWGDHVIAGNDWVDFLYHWDTLMLAHFSIDTGAWAPGEARAGASGGPLRILHAPNHRTLKGTRHFVDAVETLRKEGLEVELVVLERVPNERVRDAIASADVVADQLVIGWYALFAIEAMALERPVLCSVREDLEELYVDAGLIERGELPLVRCTPATTTEVLRRLCHQREQLAEIGRRGREYVIRHHSLEAVGAVFARINASLGLEARAA